eukprot:scaffold18080_cov48-Phaeocystis_antarctica.AAC.1
MQRGRGTHSQHTAAAARNVAGGLHRRWHHLLPRANGLRRHSQRIFSVRTIPPRRSSEGRGSHRVAGVRGRRRAGSGVGARSAAAALRGSGAMGRPSTPPPAPAPFSQVPLQPRALAARADRQLALAARAPHRADNPDRRGGRARSRRAATRLGEAHASRTCRALRSSPSLPHDSALWRPSRRDLESNDLSGSLPSQLGLLTALAGHL